MSGPDPSRDEALARLNKRADALEAQSTREKVDYGAQVSGQAYRILAELIGGVAIGFVLGFIVDRYAGTTPFGMVIGVLGGFGISVWMAKRTADRLIAVAKSDPGSMKSVPFDDEED